MLDPIVKDRLELVLTHAYKIQRRIINIDKAEIFILTDEGEQLYDSLITRLQAMGENLRKINEIDKTFIQLNLSIDVNPMIRFRNIVSHHYEFLDHEIIFNICKTEVPKVISAIEKFLQI